MKIKVMSNALQEGLKRVLPAANAKNTIAVYANVKIATGDGCLCLTATNGTLTIYSEIDCEVDEAGCTTMPIQLLSRIVSTLPAGEVALVENDDKMKVRSGASKFSLSGLPADQFPEISMESNTTSVVISASDIRKLVKRTSYAQSVDDSRKTLQGVLFEIGNGRVRLIATDGRRLAISEKDEVQGADGEVNRYIVPSSSIVAFQNFLQGDGDAAIEGSGSMMCLSLNGGKQKLYTQLVAGVYPDYTQVIPKTHSVEAVLDREMVLSAIQRVSVMEMSGLCSMKTTFSDNMMTLNVNGMNDGNARDEIPIKYAGEKIEAFYNPKYVIESLKTIDSDEVTIELTDGRQPAKFVSKDDRFMYVLMPLRISNVV